MMSLDVKRGSLSENQGEVDVWYGSDKKGRSASHSGPDIGIPVAKSIGVADF